MLTLGHCRLRDMTSENEQEQRRRIAEMEKDMTGIDDLQCMSDALALLTPTD